MNMFFNISIAATTFLSPIITVALAQDPGTKATPSAPAAAATAQDPPISPKNADTSSESKSARELARQWLRTKGWTRGNNDDGSYIAIGTSAFNAKSQKTALVRSNAFQLAALKAKNELAEFLSVEISSDVAALLKEGKIPEGENGALKDVVESLADGVRKSGTPADDVLNSTEFASSVRTAARAEVVGTTVSNSFETYNSAGDGAFAVVLRFTKTSRELANAAMGKGEAPRNEKLADAKTWADQASQTDLFQTFGVRIFQTGKGEVCFLAFGQAEVNGKSDNAFDIATEKAKAAAYGELRQFVGEFVQSEMILSRASSFSETAKAGSEYSDAEGFQKTIVARSGPLKVQGAKIIRDWEGQAEGKTPTAGVVMMWSVSSADVANELRKQMEQVGGSKGGAGRENSNSGSGPVDRDLPKLKPGNSGPTIPEP